jgi:proline racemase/trans-L-3-hydroxyproline dehydratase
MEPRLITTVDYHTAGEPFRIVTGGVPRLEGRTILDKRRFAMDRLDQIRRLLVQEPRGHADMYGCFVTDPEDSGADIGVVFFHNDGFSTACGHGTIALATWAIESGRVAAPSDGEAELRIDVPSGRLQARARIEQGSVRQVTFRNVPSFVLSSSIEVTTSQGQVEVDVAYGGAFYASVSAQAVGGSVEPTSLQEFIQAFGEIKPQLEEAIRVEHPLEPELSGIYGVIFFDPLESADSRLVQRNVTVFANKEIDRSPCGSGTSARLAVLASRGEIRVGQELVHRSIVGTEFRARIIEETEVDRYPAVVTEVAGSAYATGRHEFFLDPSDPLMEGFLLR